MENETNKITRRPLIGVVSAFIGGILFRLTGLKLPICELFILAFFLTLLVFVFSFQKFGKIKLFNSLGIIILFTLIILSGYISTTLRIADFSKRTLQNIITSEREAVFLKFIIKDDPDFLSEYTIETSNIVYRAKAIAIKRLPDWQETYGEITIIQKGTNLLTLSYGQYFCGFGLLIDRAKTKTGWYTPTKEWEINQRFLFIVNEEDLKLLKEPSKINFHLLCYELRAACAKILSKGLENKITERKLLQSLILGYRYRLPEEIKSDFLATGTYHIFAISGQHITILALFIVAILQAKALPIGRWFYYLLPILIIFTVASGSSPSAVRGCIMGAVLYLAPMMKRKPDCPSAMAFSALLMLAIDPLLINDYGFLLSFIAVTGLIYLPQKLRTDREDYIQLEKHILMRSPIATIVFSIKRWFFFLFVSTLSAWLITTPLIVYWFNLFSPVAIICNLIVIPTSALILLAGSLSIISGAFSDFMAEVFNAAGAGLAAFTISVCDTFSKIPLGHLYIPHIPLWFVGVVYLTIYVIICFKGNVIKTIVIKGSIILLFIASLFIWFFEHKKCEAKIINVDGIPVVYKYESFLSGTLVNVGNRVRADAVIKRLRKSGANKINDIVLPKVLSPYAGAILEIMNNFKIKKILYYENTRKNHKLEKSIKEKSFKLNISLSKLPQLTNDLVVLHTQTFYIGIASNEVLVEGNGHSCDSNCLFKVGKTRIVCLQNELKDHLYENIVSTNSINTILLSPGEELLIKRCNNHFIDDQKK